ncbi:unnamed protein product [Lactuca virosa]|uniref:Uncharacterized protein n=1 Tax=Lactuca virosa TaxID=75947 RepID=A0AAU9NRF0_9ASTR|nr:unnamed protein product [Lactuca virosa]
MRKARKVALHNAEHLLFPILGCFGDDNPSGGVLLCFVLPILGNSHPSSCCFFSNQVFLVSDDKIHIQSTTYASYFKISFVSYFKV